MSRLRKSAILALVWVTPTAWLLVALFTGPSDGTTITAPTGLPHEATWGETPAVVRSYGDTPLQPGDLILEVDGLSLGEWIDRGGADRAVGDHVSYRVRRPGVGLDRELDLDVELTSYPLREALTANAAPAVLVVLLLGAASFVFWRRPTDPAARAFLAVGTLTPAAATAYPLGLGPIDLAGSRGVWPHLGGEIAFTLALGSAVAITLAFPWVRRRLQRKPIWWAVVPLLPFAGYAVWALAVADRRGSATGRLEGLITVSGAALAVSVPVMALAIVHGYLRSPTREDRTALRLVVLALGAALVVWLIVGEVPRSITGHPLVPWSVQALVLVPTVLACLVAAMLRYRLQEIDAAARRSLIQLIVASLIGAVFLAAVGAVNLAADTSYASMVLGGVVALILLPLALGLRRGVSSLVYGDRAFPYRVVSELRRLDPVTAPGDALHEMLTVLGRSLRLSFVSVEVFGSSADDRIATSIGEARGQPTDVVLSVGGATVGQLSLEVSPTREPFGPRDRRLLEDIGSQVGALVQAVTANRELQRSRERMVAAREEERRRVRRDLHDGLGPSLAALAIKLEVARDLIADDPDGAARLVGDLSEQARGDIGEVRRLVDGLRPPALDQLGLVSALRQRADEHNAAVRLGRGERSMTWTVRAEDGVEPLPAAVEVAAYRIVIEAVNNSLRHGHARSCAVGLARRDGSLTIEISDDGNGLPATPGTGVGIGSMRERAEELGGTFAMESASGHGTRILVTMPVTAGSHDESPG